MKLRTVACITALFSACLAARADGPVYAIVGGNADRGAALIQAFGCGRCHTVPGIENAKGNVGPPLSRVGSRSFIAGLLPNTPPNLVRWLRFPQGVLPGNAMPDMGVDEAQARDIAAYLYTLR